MADDDLADDVLNGMTEICRYLNIKERQGYELAETGLLPLRNQKDRSRRSSRLQKLASCSRIFAEELAMWTRRETVVGGALTLLFGGRASCLCAAESPVETVGCLIADAHLERIYPNGADTAYITGEDSIIFNS